MYLIELICKVIIMKRRGIIAFTSNTILIILFYCLLFSSKEIVYPLVISIFILVIYFTIEVFKFHKFTLDLKDAKISPDYNFVSSEIHYKLIFDTMNNIHTDYAKKIYMLRQENKTRNTLYSQWIHNMKTAITIIDLACERLTAQDKCSSNYLNDIVEENNKLKINLEECLNVLRLDDFSRDYVPEKANLYEIVYNVVNSKKRDFIYTGIQPKVKIDKNIQIYTDKKWCSYMIEQILSNSIKYTNSNKNKKIYIYCEIDNENTSLIIEDEGIGINLEDMPRVFHPFFTGDNGRHYRNATGIGMYMVKSICDKLQHRVYINSKKGEGTKVKLCFLSKV